LKKSSETMRLLSKKASERRAKFSRVCKKFHQGGRGEGLEKKKILLGKKGTGEGRTKLRTTKEFCNA